MHSQACTIYLLHIFIRTHTYDTLRVNDTQNLEKNICIYLYSAINAWSHLAKSLAARSVVVVGFEVGQGQTCLTSLNLYINYCWELIKGNCRPTGWFVVLGNIRRTWCRYGFHIVRYLFSEKVYCGLVVEPIAFLLAGSAFRRPQSQTEFRDYVDGWSASECYNWQV